jgi:hypothetical protein
MRTRSATGGIFKKRFKNVYFHAMLQSKVIGTVGSGDDSQRHDTKRYSVPSKVKRKRKGWIQTKRKNEKNYASGSLRIDQLKVFYYKNMMK